MKYKHLCAFTEFESKKADPIETDASKQLGNPYKLKELATKLHLYAEASTIPKLLTQIVYRDRVYMFDIYTEIPADIREFGEKMFRVEIADGGISKSKIITYEGDKEKGYTPVSQTSLEVAGENNLSVILWNYIEATQLFDDNVTEVLVDAAKELNTIQDVQNKVKFLGQ